MSFARFVYYSALLGGWAAFLGWLVVEVLFFRRGAEPGFLGTTVIGGIVGAAICVGVCLASGLTNARLSQLAARGGVGLAGGAVFGAVGALLGNVLYLIAQGMISGYALWLPRAFGWMIMGLGIGIVGGIYDRSGTKIRNGLIGGTIGGLVGGLLFDPLVTVMSGLVGAGSGMSSRATAFVILGMCIGALIGLVQVVLKDAWLTVLDGYRAGRQLILTQPVTMLGRADHLPMPFLGPMNKDLESEHVRITRQSGGSYLVEDNHSKLGTRLNNQPLSGAAVLKDGDVIKLGTNFVRFNERHRKDGEAAPTPAAQPQVSVAPPPPRVKAGAPPAARPAPSAAPPAPAKPAATAVPPAATAPPKPAAPPAATVPPAAAAPPPPRPAAASAPPKPAIPPAPAARPGGIPPPPPPKKK